MTWDQAIEALFRAAHGDFVTERKRLAGELRTAGDKAGAAKLNKLNRPPASAWAVNQLWWRSRAEFQALLDSARRVREGALDALPAHKAGIAALSQLAAGYLKDMGNAAQDATLRRVETSLAAIAAGGGFDPDPAGALTDDREPSGFLSLGIAPGGHVEPLPPPAPKPAPPKLTIAPPPEPEPEDEDENENEDEENAPNDAEARAEAEAAARRAAEEAARKQVEEERRAAQIETARAHLLEAVAAVSRLEGELTDARRVMEAAKARLDALQRPDTDQP